MRSLLKLCSNKFRNKFHLFLIIVDRLIEEQRRRLNELIELEASTKWKLEELDKLETMNIYCSILSFLAGLLSVVQNTSDSNVLSV